MKGSMKLGVKLDLKERVDTPSLTSRAGPGRMRVVGFFSPSESWVPAEPEERRGRQKEAGSSLEGGD